MRISTFKGQNFLRVLACPQKEASGLSRGVEAVLPLADLMRDADTGAGNFDLLVLAQRDGKVLYSSEINSEDNPQNIFAKFSSLGSFFQKNQFESESKGVDSDEENNQKDRDGQIAVPFMSVMREAEVSDMTYQLFLQPFQAPLPIMPPQARDLAAKPLSQLPDAQSVWYLGGIIRKSEFQRRYMAVSLMVTGLAMLGLILGVLSLPYIKMFFANVGEPLRVIDIFFLILSLVLGCGLITLLLLNTSSYLDMRARFDQTAEDISVRIKKRFQEELSSTLKALSEVPCVIADNEFPISKDSQHPPKKDGFFELSKNSPPLYESIFLVENHGVLEPENWMTFKSRDPTSSSDISERKYFVRAKEKRDLWRREYREHFVREKEKREPEQQEEPLNFFVERVHSYTDGVKIAVVSTPYEGCESNEVQTPTDSNGNEKNERFKVTTLSKRFLSLRALTLPPSFGFAVVDDTGMVLFHSEDRRSLIENFFWETDGDMKLQAVVQARQKDVIVSHYNGNKHRFFARPIDLDGGVPWMLVVFYNPHLLETISFEIGVITVGIFFLYIGLSALLIGVIQLFIPGENWFWCWPQFRSWNRYVWMVGLLIVFILCYGVCIWMFKDRLSLLLVVSLPMFVIGSLYLCFRSRSRHYRQEYRYAKSVFQFGYLIVAYLSVVTVSVLSVMGIFEYTSSIQAERFAEFRKSAFPSAVGERKRMLHRYMKYLDDSYEVDENMWKERKNFENMICPGLHFYAYDQINLSSPAKQKVDDCLQIASSEENMIGRQDNKDMFDWFADRLPVYNRWAGELRYSGVDPPGPSQTGDDPPKSTGPPQSTGPSQTGDDLEVKYEPSPSLRVFRPRGDWSSWFFYLGSLTFLFALFFVIRALARRVVGIYLSDFELLEDNNRATPMRPFLLPDGSPKENIEENTIEYLAEAWTGTKTDIDKKRRILVRPPRDLVSKLTEHAKERGFDVVDLSLSPTQLALGQLKRLVTVSPETGVLVTNFESGILETRLRLTMLKALEHVPGEKPVIICSSVSPLYRLVSPEAYPNFDEDSRSAVSKTDEKFRWSALFATFWKERFWYEASYQREDGEDVLSRECCWTDELTPIYDDLKGKIKNLTEEQIIHHVGDQSEAFYRTLWMFCTKEERLVLIHIAQGNLVNLKNADVVQRLLWRNLVRRDPDFRLPSESFVRFVLTAELPARVAEWEKGEADGSTWAMLRAPLLLLLVLMAAFIAQTGGEGVNATIATISAALTGLPILIQVLNFLRGGQTVKLTDE